MAELAFPFRRFFFFTSFPIATAGSKGNPFKIEHLPRGTKVLLAFEEFPSLPVVLIGLVGKGNLPMGALLLLSLEGCPSLPFVTICSGSDDRTSAPILEDFSITSCL